MASLETTLIIDTAHASISEAWADGSRSYTSGDNPTASVRYIGRGFTDTSAAYTAINNLLYTESPIEPFIRGADGKPRFHGLPVTSIEVSRASNAYLYDIVVNCSVPNYTNAAGSNGNPGSEISTDPSYTPPVIEDSQFSYTSGQQSTHVDFGRGVIARARYDGGTPIQYQGIGPQADGTFSGADMLTTYVQVSIQRSEPKWFMTTARRVTLANLTNTLNNDTYIGFPARCVMFCGVNTSKRWLEWTDSSGTHKDWYWVTSYNFNVRPAASIVVGSTTLNFGGWDAISFEDEGIDTTGGTTIWSPGQVSQWSLYNSADFALLGLTFPA